MPSTRRLALTACALLASAVALPAAADAGQRTTTYYTIDVTPSSSSGPATVLGALASTGRVVNQVYGSGDLRQQWTPTYPEWPTSPSVTANATGWTCSIPLVICGYEPAERPYPQKFVNRATGRCLTLVAANNDTGWTRPCAPSGPTLRTQLWSWSFLSSAVRASGVPRTYAPLAVRAHSGGASCLTSSSSLPGYDVSATPCVRSGIPRQKVRFLQVASVTCSAISPTVLCGTRPR